jgi:hypothetical protein
MFEMEHLVIHDVLDGGAGNAGMVEDTADYDGIMSRIVVAEAIAGPVATPGHLRASQQAMEKPRIELLKDRFQVVGPALGGIETLASAHLAHQVSLPADVVAGHVTPVSGRGFAIDRSAVHLGQKDVGDGAQHRFRRALQEIGKPHQQFALAHPDGVFDAGKSEEFNF